MDPEALRQGRARYKPGEVEMIYRADRDWAWAVTYPGFNTALGRARVFMMAPSFYYSH